MQMWLVTWSHTFGEYHGVLGVFGSEELAQAEIDEYPVPRRTAFTIHPIELDTIYEPLDW